MICGSIASGLSGGEFSLNKLFSSSGGWSPSSFGGLLLGWCDGGSRLR